MSRNFLLSGRDSLYARLSTGTKIARCLWRDSRDKLLSRPEEIHLFELKGVVGEGSLREGVMLPLVVA